MHSRNSLLVRLPACAPAARVGRRRPGLTLLEVLIALAIFLMAMIVFGEMFVHNGEMARNVQRQNQATRLCQSKLAEVVKGAVPLSSQDDQPFDEEPDYLWSLSADQGQVDGLWNVTVRVVWQGANGAPIDCSLSQMVLDPSILGSTQDVTTVTTSSTNSATGSSSSSSTPAATTPAATPPAATTPAATPPKTTPAATPPAATTTPTTKPAATTPAATPPAATTTPTTKPGTTKGP